MRRLLSVALSVFLAAVLLAAGPQATAEPPRAAASEASTFTSLSPVRVLDTRTGTGVPVGSGGTVELDLSARVPATATAVVLNVTGVTPTASTHVTVFPTGAARPNTSSLNLVAGEIRANQVTFNLTVTDVTAATFVTAWPAGAPRPTASNVNLTAPDYGASFLPLTPARVLDTRNGTGGTTGPLGPGAEIQVPLGNDLPTTATGVVLNLTGVTRPPRRT